MFYQIKNMLLKYKYFKFLYPCELYKKIKLNFPHYFKRYYNVQIFVEPPVFSVQSIWAISLG